MTNLTIKQHRQLTQSRGRNDLLDAAYRDMGRAAFRKDLIFAAILAVVIAVVWSM